MILVSNMHPFHENQADYRRVISRQSDATNPLGRGIESGESQLPDWSLVDHIRGPPRGYREHRCSGHQIWQRCYLERYGLLHPTANQFEGRFN